MATLSVGLPADNGGYACAPSHVGSHGHYVIRLPAILAELLRPGLHRPGRREDWGLDPEPQHAGELVQTPRASRLSLMERHAMTSSSVPDPDGFGDHPDQYTGDPVRRLRVPGAGAAPWQGRAASPIGPARSRHLPRSRRPGVRREYDHQPDAPAASCVAPCASAAVRDAPPVIVTLPAQINTATAEQINAAVAG